MSQEDRDGILEMGAPRLDDIAEFDGFFPKSSR
jgi:hypothetical protein